MNIRWRLAVAAAVAAAAVVPGLVAAHPLGNFTINHYAGLTVETERVILDIVIDEAEIPAFQSRRALDADGDGDLSPAERDRGAVDRCAALSTELELSVDGTPLAVGAGTSVLSMAPGSGGLPTLRLECGFVVPLPTPIDADRPTRLGFADRSRPERLGWREIVATGNGVDLRAVEGDLRPTSPSARLTRYPADAARPLADAGVVLEARLDPTAQPAGDAPAGAPVISPGTEALPAIFTTPDLTPLLALAAILAAALLGAGHALTPGHGKALIAAYLVGTRGTARQAVGLGLSVSLSHTLGILVLAAVVIGAADVLPADFVVRVAPLAAALSILVIGAWMVIAVVRRRPHGHDHGHPHPHGHAHPHEHDHDHAHGDSSQPHPLGWRGLFALGLAGGLIPSTSALLILLGAIAAGRPAFGLVLVVAFGLGMAGVMTTIGLVTVVTRERLGSIRLGGRGARLAGAMPITAAVAVLAFGVAMTAGAAATLGLGVV